MKPRKILVVFVILLALCLFGCSEQNSGDEGIAILPNQELPADAYSAVTHKYGTELALISIQPNESSYVLYAKDGGIGQMCTIELDADFAAGKKSPMKEATSVDELPIPVLELNGNEYTYRRDSRVSWNQRHIIEVNGNRLNQPEPFSDGAVLRPCSVFKIGNTPYAVMVKELFVSDIPQWQGTFLACMEDGLQPIMQLQCDLEPSHFCWNDEYGFYVEGDYLKGTDGSVCWNVCDLNALGVNMVLDYTVTPLNDGRFIIVQSYQLLEIKPHADEPGNMETLPSETETTGSEADEYQVIRMGVYPAAASLPAMVIPDAFCRSGSKAELQVKTYESKDQLNLAMLSGEIDFLLSEESGVISEYAKRGLVSPLPDLEGIVLDNLLEAGTINGEVYMLPTCYQVLGLIMPLSLQNPQGGFNSVEDMLNAIDCLDNDDYLYCSSKDEVLQSFSWMGWDNWLDYETMTCSFTDSDFVEVLKLCNRYTQSASQANSIQESHKNGELLKICWFSSAGAGFERYYVDRYTEESWSSHGSEAEIFSWPGSGSKGLTALGTMYWGLPAQGNRNAGEELVKVVLQKSTQEAMAHGTYPITIDALKARWAFFKDNSEPSSLQKGWEIATGANHFPGTSTEINRVIKEEALTYFNGGCSAEECASRIQNRVSIYMAEQG